MQNNYLFIYGTLRKEIAPSEFIHNLLDRYADFVDDGYVQGKLYDIGSYPGLIPSDNSEDKVAGEVFKLADSEEVLNTFDEYEGCSPRFPEPWEYVRKKVKVILKKGGIVNAWVYQYNLDISDKTLITSGDYLEFQNR
jgi:gamma-glutamylcyclotransferase (GGCT)/AIG2-like uncharacterized protein YtfP